MEFYGTLGPACASAEVLSRMLDAGLRIAAPLG